MLVVGTLSLAHPAAFPARDACKVGLYGMDYLFIPLVLPILGLMFLRRTPARDD